MGALNIPFPRSVAEMVCAFSLSVAHVQVQECDWYNDSTARAGLLRLYYPKLPPWFREKVFRQLEETRLDSTPHPAYIADAYLAIMSLQPGNADKPDLVFSCMEASIQSGSTSNDRTHTLFTEFFERNLPLAGSLEVEVSEFDIKFLEWWSSATAPPPMDRVYRVLGHRTRSGLNCFHAIVMTGHYSLIRTFVAYGHDIDEPSKFGLTALGLAISQDKIQCVKELVRCGASIQNPCFYDSLLCATPLVVATMTLKWEVLRFLLREHANPWAPLEQEYRCTVAHIAAGAAIMSPGLEILLYHEPHIRHCRDTKLLTPLHYAATNGNFEGIKVLLRFNANLAAKDIVGSTPLHTAWKSWGYLNGSQEGRALYRLTHRNIEDELENLYISRELLISSGANQRLKDRVGQAPSKAAFSQVYLASKAIRQFTYGEQGGGLYWWQGAISNCPDLWFVPGYIPSYFYRSLFVEERKQETGWY